MTTSTVASPRSQGSVSRGHLIGNTLATAAMGAAGVFASGIAARTLVPVSDAYPFSATGVFLIVMLVAVSLVRGSHPFETLGAANVVTTVRAALVALIGGLIGESMADLTAVAGMGLAIGATALDGVDGWLARRLRMTSDFGARFDMEVDALLILVLSVVCWQSDKAGAWIILSGALRYGFVAAGWRWTWLANPLPDRRRRKIVCVLQIVARIVIMTPAMRPPLSGVVAAIALSALAWSFFVDIRWLRESRTARAIRS